jgi:NTE family protein
MPWYASRADALSFYDVAPLKEMLKRLVDFDLINSGETRLSVGAVNVRTGNLVYFDSTTHRIGPEHVLASGALPPGFPATEIDGEYYWDGGIVSNTPLQWVLETRPRRDTLAFQVDFWSARGELPRDFFKPSCVRRRFDFRAARERRRTSTNMRSNSAPHLRSF